MLQNALGKADSYISWGAQSVWIIDPEKRTAWTVSPEGGSEAIWIAPNWTLRIDNTAIELPVLFAKVDEKFDTGAEQE